MDYIVRGTPTFSVPISLGHPHVVETEMKYFVFVNQIFPINIKGSAGSLASMVSWIGAWFVSYSFNFLFEWSSAGKKFLLSLPL